MKHQFDNHRGMVVKWAVSQIAFGIWLTLRFTSDIFVGAIKLENEQQSLHNEHTHTHITYIHFN